VSEDNSDSVFFEDRFAVAEVALYIFYVLQVVAALLTAIGGASIGSAPHATEMQRISLTASTVLNILGFAAGYLLVGRLLKRRARLVWRVAGAIFLANIVLTALAALAQPSPSPILTCCLSVAGLLSLWKGRHAVRP
jgi:hypothetical protein